MASIYVAIHLYNRDYLPFIPILDCLDRSSHVPRSATLHPREFERSIRNIVSHLDLPSLVVRHYSVLYDLRAYPIEMLAARSSVGEYLSPPLKL